MHINGGFSNRKSLSLTTQAHHIINQYLNSGDVAIDATLGNGHDVLFLAKKVGVHGKVFGFDIQQEALNSTRSRLETEISTSNITLNHRSHEQIAEYIPEHLHGKVRAVMFNLGYLPGGDKSIITQVDSTLSALQQSLSLLARSAILTILAYPGHTGGAVETQRIDLWCKQLDATFFDFQRIAGSKKATAPILFIVKKLVTTQCLLALRV